MTTKALNIIDHIAREQDISGYQQVHWTGTFPEYLDLFRQSPRVARSAYQRVHAMILSHGVEPSKTEKDALHYLFFDDSLNQGKDGVFGLDKTLQKLVSIFKSGACRYGAEKRVLLLHGPVGSAKSTIARLLKKGIEAYSRSEEGAIYTFGWKLNGNQMAWCPMHEEPLYLLPRQFRDNLLAEVNAGLPREEQIVLDGAFCPSCRQYYREFLDEAGGDWTKLIERVAVKRLLLSEQDRIGIGTFQPKDEKNQDSTELTGDINYRKIAEIGSDSDPRAFNFDGEFNVANRGVIEFIEVLKLDVAFLYDLLGASQEHKIKPKKFAQTHIDEVIIGHTNEPEYRKLQHNEFMEALRDRTIKIDVPYITRLDDEIRIYEKDFTSEKVGGKHIAPHTIEMASMWAVLTRLEDPKKANLTLLQKLKLYNGKSLPGFTEDNVKELRDEAQREGLEGISPRYIQDKVSNALVNSLSEGYINPFMVMNELEGGLTHHSLINDERQRKRYRELLTLVKEEYADICKNEVQRAISADEEQIKRLCANYIDNVKAFTQREKVVNKYTGQKEEPDERLMRSIEEKIGITDSRKDDFRREIMNYIGSLAVEGKTFDYKSNERLHKALELKLFEDQKDSIKLTSLVSSVVDQETQAKINVIKARMIKNFGYNEQSATDVLNFVASIFARGDIRQGEQ